MKKLFILSLLAAILNSSFANEIAVPIEPGGEVGEAEQCFIPEETGEPEGPTTPPQRPKDGEPESCKNKLTKHYTDGETCLDFSRENGHTYKVTFTENGIVVTEESSNQTSSSQSFSLFGLSPFLMLTLDYSKTTTPFRFTVYIQRVVTHGDGTITLENAGTVLDPEGTYVIELVHTDSSTSTTSIAYGIGPGFFYLFGGVNGSYSSTVSDMGKALVNFIFKIQDGKGTGLTNPSDVLKRFFQSPDGQIKLADYLLFQTLAALQTSLRNPDTARELSQLLSTKAGWMLLKAQIAWELAKTYGIRYFYNWWMGIPQDSVPVIDNPVNSANLSLAATLAKIIVIGNRLGISDSKDVDKLLGVKPGLKNCEWVDALRDFMHRMMKKDGDLKKFGEDFIRLVMDQFKPLGAYKKGSAHSEIFGVTMTIDQFILLWMSNKYDFLIQYIRTFNSIEPPKNLKKTSK